MPYPAENLPPVSFQLSLAGSAGANATAKLRHFYATPSKPGKHVFELRQLNLQLALTRSRVSGEDVENELSAIDHTGVEHAFDIALLRWREVVIEQNYAGGNRSGRARNFLQLALPDQRGRFGAVPALRKFADDLGTRARSQGSQFIERFIRSEIRRISRQG
jgi:hypothetical protein